jgi:hypothetical protein
MSLISKETLKALEEAKRKQEELTKEIVARRNKAFLTRKKDDEEIERLVYEASKIFGW